MAVFDLQNSWKWFHGKSEWYESYEISTTSAIANSTIIANESFKTILQVYIFL